MVSLDKVFDRFPQLTKGQRQELARRRVIRALDCIPSDVTHSTHLWWSLGYLGTKNLFTPHARVTRRSCA